MKYEYVDIHCHLAFKRYKDDLDEVLKRMREAKVFAVTIGTDLPHSKVAVELAGKHDDIYATVGLHPADNEKEVFETSNYEQFMRDSNVVMVGECGLDYYHEKEEEGRKRQRDEFEKQIEFAVLHDKPLMLHIRDAHDDAIEILSSKKKEHGEKIRGNSHFFTASKEIAKKYYELNFSTSFPGVITFTKDYDETVKYAPSDLILSETDAPYAAPVPYRGKRNEPSYVIEVVKRIAEIRGENIEDLKRQILENAEKLTGLRLS
ncbi:MAG: TatD family hydrolase [Candidatus Pacebacteria bacterium]|jgi:TatD DNase family protein|nr:hydrolase TatD [bacterium]MDP6527402.1 TatD family hydrolase [Candidatus Paceibacterota bacterium]MDP6659528.1 TatD family hydrolase [Candidatus Paceibacterota bacterium]|tara:strand:- start:19938 stop:20723 length:786 start_codon:yes stop_codon:yes gene_type:complete